MSTGALTFTIRIILILSDLTIDSFQKNLTSVSPVRPVLIFDTGDAIISFAVTIFGFGDVCGKLPLSIDNIWELETVNFVRIAASDFGHYSFGCAYQNGRRCSRLGVSAPVSIILFVKSQKSSLEAI
ncbi:hypothetical protein DAPPUDRAFT_105349 [Daphnia pulex]|uniref:Uncharacterized protein n=1 Tax=Daphnia pulex TaxID=6669 RepID=E9GQG1_DAPPU|nr:hypothetical protein DAPPUDRAFT_105349 [Daphnia pulex]|eukprot:EFX78344.1 hypothetical protein DAPPUDRAFT_105349 [Daphnia pulex]